MHSLLKTNKLVGLKTKHVVKSTSCHCNIWNSLTTSNYDHSKSWQELSPVPPCPLVSTRLYSNLVRHEYLKRTLPLDNHNVVCLKSVIAFHPGLGFSSHESCINQLYHYTINQVVCIRRIHIGSVCHDKEPSKPSSKVEATVQAIKQDLIDSEKPQATTVEKAVAPKKSLRQKIVAEILHYYHGFRLLFIDINVSRRLVWRVLNGKSLTRREHRLLVQTVSDIFRLVPFSIFVIVPFMELLLPLAIKMFPGMLPSTFQTATEKDDKLKQSLKVKLEMAKFLQQTLDDMAVVGKGHRSEAAKEFAQFFHKVRTSGEEATNEEIMKFSKLFEDEITLDSLSRQQLAALCRVLEIQPLGTNNFLRFQLRMKLRSLATDDKVIQREGIDQLTPAELQQACKARGMRAYGLPTERLRTQLKQWLDLSLNEKVPPSLLLLSRALLLPETISTSDQLKATISVLPDTLATQTKVAIAEREGKVDNKTKIEVIKEEVRKIQEERQEEKEEKKKEIAQEEKEVLIDNAPIITTDEKRTEPEILLAKTPDGFPLPEKKKELSSSDLETLEDALDIISKDKKLLVEKEELHGLKEELAEYKEDVDDLQQMLQTVDKSKQVDVRETKAAQLLYKKVHSMIGKMDAVVHELDREGKSLKEDLKSQDHLEEKEIKKKSQTLVSIGELMDSIKQIQKVPDNSLVERITEVLEKIDDDHDGAIAVDDVLKVIELIGKDNVKLDKKQLDEILELIQKEEIFEVEGQIERALAKAVSESEAQKRAHTLKDVDIDVSASKPMTPAQEEEKKKQGSVSTVPPTPPSQSASAMAAAPHAKSADVNEPKDPKDNSKTL